MTDAIELTFHGAAQTVTGSCMEISWRGRRMLIDCGLFQGSRSLETLNREPFSFAPDKIDCVVLTHAHIDHSGLLPRLVAEGFAGPIWCTEPTRDLLTYMLPDAGRIQEGEAERRNRRADRADEPLVPPIYTEADSVRAVGQARPIALVSGSNRCTVFARGFGMPDIFWDRPPSNFRPVVSDCCSRAISGRQTRHFTPIQMGRHGSTISSARAPMAIATVQRSRSKSAAGRWRPRSRLR